jgi:hypothetical protein
MQRAALIESSNAWQGLMGIGVEGVRDQLGLQGCVIEEYQALRRLVRQDLGCGVAVLFLNAAKP